MKLKHRKPLLWFIVKLLYKVDFNDIKAFSFGDTIYTPTVTNDYVIIVHEKKHLEQQRHSKVYAVICFIRYYMSKRYRFTCELEAWQYAIKEAGALREYAAKVLSSRFYGNLVTYEEALKLL